MQRKREKVKNNLLRTLLPFDIPTYEEILFGNEDWWYHYSFWKEFHMSLIYVNDLSCPSFVDSVFMTSPWGRSFTTISDRVTRKSHVGASQSHQSRVALKCLILSDLFRNWFQAGNLLRYVSFNIYKELSILQRTMCSTILINFVYYTAHEKVIWSMKISRASKNKSQHNLFCYHIYLHKPVEAGPPHFSPY